MRKTIESCERCKEPLQKEKHRYCAICEGTLYVLGKMRAGEEIAVQELRTLPNILLFDPAGNDPEEAAYAIQFSQYIRHIENAQKQEFESLVNSEGCKTGVEAQKTKKAFESLVNSGGVNEQTRRSKQNKIR